MSTKVVHLYKNITTNQEAFDGVVRHMAKQKKRAFENGCKYIGCKYITQDGLRCAIGGIMPIEAAKRLERQGGEGIENAYAEGAIDLPEEVALDLLAELQVIHDDQRCDGVNAAEQLRADLNHVAEQWGLDNSLVETITEWNRD